MSDGTVNDDELANLSHSYIKEVEEEIGKLYNVVVLTVGGARPAHVALRHEVSFSELIKIESQGHGYRLFQWQRRVPALLADKICKNIFVRIEKAVRGESKGRG